MLTADINTDCSPYWQRKSTDRAISKLKTKIQTNVETEKLDLTGFKKVS